MTQHTKECANFLGSSLYTGWPQKLAHSSVCFITSSDIDQFLNFFYFQHQEKICDNTGTNRSHHTWNVSLHYFLKCQCLEATVENKTNNNIFKKLTTGNNVFIVSVIVLKNLSHPSVFHQMFTVSTLLLDDALLKCVVTKVALFSIVAFKTLTFHKVVQRHAW